MTNVIGREECSMAHWIDACKIHEAGKIAHNFYILNFVTALLLTFVTAMTLKVLDITAIIYSPE
jgi:hypothetical protein